MCPPFTREVSYDGTSVVLTVEGGIVTKVELGKTAAPHVGDLASELIGLPYVDLEKEPSRRGFGYESPPSKAFIKI
jgi:hypothetical protein